jgi:nitroimidazol reductase NimA-like FMN-containing flavoprotein (pyridoxamine 5'-phosphate oxidase superfamily)
MCQVQVRWQELTRSECFRLLASRHLGRIVLIDELGPAAFPVNYVLDGHTLLFRTDEGSKLDAALRGARVAFQIDGADETSRTGWSVLVRAEAVEVVDSDDLAQVRKLPLYPWAPGAKTHYVRLLPALLTGRRIAAPDNAPSNWFG